MKDGHHVESCDYCIRIFADLPHPDPAGRQVVYAATPARRKWKRNRYDENSSSSEEDSSSSSPESSDDDDCYDDSEDGDSGKSQALVEIQSPCSSSSRRSCPYPKWDKRCHLCGKKYDHKGHLREHMLSHKDGGHDIDHCDHCLTNLAWTQRKGVTPKDTLDMEKIRGKTYEKRLCISYQLPDEDQSDSCGRGSQSAACGQQTDNEIVVSGNVDENNEHVGVSFGSERADVAQDVDDNKSRAAHAEVNSEEAIMYQKCALFCRSLMSGCESLDRQAAADEGNGVKDSVSDVIGGSDEEKDETACQEEQMREEADEVELNDDHELDDHNLIVNLEEALQHNVREFGKYADEEGYAVHVKYNEERKEFVELSLDGETLLITIID